MKKKKIVLEGELTHGFMGSAGNWYTRINKEQLDYLVAKSLGEEGWFNKQRGDDTAFNAGQVRITIEMVEE